MNDDARKQLEYEEQFFGMSSQFFADSFKNFVKDELDSKISILVENFKSKLIKQAENPENFEEALKTMKQNLINEYHKSLEQSYPELKSRISSFLHIPDNVLLSEDLPVRQGVGKDINHIKEEIENLTGTYKSILYLNQEIQDEIEEADSAIFLMECILNKKKLDFEVLPVEDISALSKINNSLVENNF